ncbi:MAG: M24 family metallopeptidase [bacterium]
MLNPKTAINNLRTFLTKENLDYFLVKYTDEYLNEYVELQNNSRYLLTGFSGSTGDALVSNEEVFLFVDGRYHIQADEETDSELVNVVKLDLSITQLMAIVQIIKNNNKNSLKIGIPSTKTSLYFYNKLIEELNKLGKNVEIIEYEQDPILSTSNNTKEELMFVYPDISGELTEEKYMETISELKKQGIDTFLITKLEEIAYLANLRSFATPYNSTFKGVALIYDYQLYIFTEVANVVKEIRNKFSPDVIFKKFEEFETVLQKIKADSEIKTIGYDETSITLSNYRKLEKLDKNIKNVKPNPLSEMKSIKNTFELEHFRENFLKTDIVVARCIQTLNQKLEAGQKMTEKEFSAMVKKIFDQEGALSLSFEPITACATNSAIIHYSSPNPDKNINVGDLFLLDCGGYFDGGYATDITRTFIAGGKIAKPEEKAKRIYTKVLKGLLSGLNYPINQTTTGYDIDKKVREVVTQEVEEGFSFPHGTGHGVGISVHESPPRLGSSELSKTVLKEGMCFTIEPGLYCEGWGGVRLENTVTVIEEKGSFRIKSLTRSGFDENLIDYSMLSENEKVWLNKYKQGIIGK